MPRMQHEKAAAFRALHQGPSAFVIPNPWDAGSARILASLGFKALATTSGGLASALGRPDGRGVVSREETLENARAIVEATDLPVSADLENCFAHAPEEAAQTIRLAGEAGLVGGSIEDATGDPANPIYAFEHAVARVRAAVAAARALPFPFMLTARAENFLHGRADLEDTIRRLQAFEAAGADVLYAPGLPTAEAVRAVCAAVSRPVNFLVGPRLPLTIAQASELGVRRISVGSSLSRVALGAFITAARQIAETGTFDSLAPGVPYAEVNALMAGTDRS